MIVETILAMALSAPADPSLKCARTHHLPGYGEDSAIILLDGEIRGSNLDGHSLTEIDPEDVAQIEIACWNPDTGELPASGGVQLIVVSTNSTMAAAEAQSLQAARLVHAFVAENDEIPRSLEQLDKSLAGYSIEVGELGWKLTSPDISGIACSTSELGSAAEEVGCQRTYSVAKRNLRDAWERGTQAF